MRRALLPALLLVASCDRVFDLSEAPFEDAPLAPEACPAPRTLRVPVTNDVLISENLGPDPRAEVMLLAPGTAALLRFELAEQVDPMEIVGVQLVLPREPADPQCGTDCASRCEGAVEADGTLALHPMRADWIEDSVSWTCRVEAPTCKVWLAAGARGEFGDSPDRGAVVATMLHKAGSLTELSVDPDRLGEVRRFLAFGQSISFQVTTEDARFAMATKDEAACDAGLGEPVPELVLYLCD